MRSAIPAALLGASALLGGCGGSDLVLPSDGEPAAIAAEGGTGQHGAVRQPLADSLVARVSDARGRPVVGARVAFVVTSGGAGAAVAPDTATTDGSGQAAAQWVLGADAGTQTVAARVVATSSPRPIEAAFEASASASHADTIRIAAGDNQAAPPGQALHDSLAVRVVDGFGNPVAGVTVRWAAAGGGSVSPASSVSGSDGRAAARRTVGIAIGLYTTTATASGLHGSPITFTAIAAYPPGTQPGSMSARAGDNQRVTVGTAVAVPPSVLVKDPNGQPMSAVAVSFRVGSGGGSVTASSAVTDASGIATVGAWTLGTGAGQQTLIASVGGSGVSGNPLTFSVTAIPGAPDPTTTDAVVPSTAPPLVPVSITVRTRDAYGNSLDRGGASVGVVLRKGKSRTPLQVTDQSDGTYTASVSVFALGTYAVDVTLGGVAVKGSPYPLVVEEK